MEFERELANFKRRLSKLDCAACPKTIKLIVESFDDELVAVIVSLLLDEAGAASFQGCDDAVVDAFYDSGFTKERFYFDGTDIGVAADDEGLRERGLHFYSSGAAGKRHSRRIHAGEVPKRIGVTIKPIATNPQTTQARAKRISDRLDAVLRDRAQRLARGQHT